MHMVATGGLIWVALYNDQGQASRAWSLVKRSYVSGGTFTRRALLAGASTYFALRGAPGTAVRKLAGRPVPQRPRGMDRRRDLVDWVGGWPFEVSKPEQILEAGRKHGLELIKLKTMGSGLGCNEYLFRRP